MGNSPIQDNLRGKSRFNRKNSIPEWLTAEYGEDEVILRAWSRCTMVRRNQRIPVLAAKATGIFLIISCVSYFIHVLTGMNQGVESESPAGPGTLFCITLILPIAPLILMFLVFLPYGLFCEYVYRDVQRPLDDALLAYDLVKKGPKITSANRRMLEAELGAIAMCLQGFGVSKANTLSGVKGFQEFRSHFIRASTYVKELRADALIGKKDVYARLEEELKHLIEVIRAESWDDLRLSARAKKSKARLNPAPFLLGCAVLAVPICLSKYDSKLGPGGMPSIWVIPILF